MFFCPLSASLVINFSCSSFIFSFNSDSILPGIDDLISLKVFDFTSLFICHPIGQQGQHINNSVPSIFYINVLCLSGMFVTCHCIGPLVSWSTTVVSCSLFGLPGFLSCQSLFFYFFCNIRNSFLSCCGPQLYNSEALPFTYDQYVVIELADKLYNSATVCFCVCP